MNAGERDPKAAQRAYEAQMVRAAAHPIRAKALSMMSERASSPKEIAAAVGKPIGNVTYHVNALEKAGLATLVEEKKRGGATEHFYVATNFTDEESEQLGPDARKAAFGSMLHLIIVDTALALESGTLDRRPDTHLARIPLYVDEEGWREIRDIYIAALDAALRVQAACAERLDREGGQGFRALAAALMFEMSGRPERD